MESRWGAGMGHGQPGLRDGIRTFDDFERQVDNERHLYIDLQLARAAGTGWAASGNRYERAWAEFADGLMADVVAVETEDEVLTFVETAADCAATAGTWHYNSLRATAPNLWDLGFQFDVGQAWDAPFLSVHLTGNADPNAKTIAVFHGVHYSNAGIIHPTFGPKKITANGGLETWTAGTPDGFVKVIGGGGTATIEQETAFVYEGLSSARLGGTLAANEASFLRFTATTKAEWMYSMSGAYASAAAKDTNVHAYIATAFDGSSQFVDRDGLTATATQVLSLRDTGGEWRRFVFHFIPPADGTNRFRFGVHNTNPFVSESGFVWFDDLQIRPVRRFAQYIPRLLPGGSPRLSMGAAGPFFGDKRVGAAGTFRFGNSGKHWEQVLGGSWEPLGGRAMVRGGGIFRTGMIVPMEDTVGFGVGIVRETDVSDNEATITTEDPATIFDTLLPLKTYNVQDQPDGEVRDRGRYRPYLYGYKEGIRPSRVARNPDSGLPIYEIADPSIAADTSVVLFSFGGGVENAYVYESEEAADKEDESARVAIFLTTDYTMTPSLARLNIIKNPGPYRVRDGENDRIDWSVNGVLQAPVEMTPALYTSDMIVDSLNAQMGGAGLTWTYYDVAGAAPAGYMQVSYVGAGNLVLQAAAGTNKGRSFLSTIGFNASTDYTIPNGNSQAGDVAMFDVATGADKIIFRVNANGYKDDASGTYTGIPNDRIFKAGDVFAHQHAKVFKRPLSEIGTTFVSARNTAYQQLSAYIGCLASVQDGLSGQVSFGKIVQALETGAVGDFKCDGEGVWQFVVRQAGLAGISLADGDFKRDPRFRTRRRIDEAFATTRILFQQHPSTARVRSVESVSKYTTTVVRRKNPKNFFTFLEAEADAYEILSRIALITIAGTRHPIFAVKGRLLRKRPGDVAILTRDQAQGAPGAPSPSLSAVSFRILSLSIDYLGHDVVAECHTNISNA